MDFSKTPKQLELYQKISEFAQNELNKDIISKDLDCRFNEEGWKKCAEFGILALGVPTEYGGQGHDLLTVVSALEGLGYGCRDNGLTFAITSQSVSVLAVLLQAGSEEQKKKYLSKVCSGELIGSYAMTEPESGSDAFSLKTTAVKQDGGYLLNGEKILITMSPVCGFSIIFATIDPSLGHWGVTAFLVDKGTEGFSLSETQSKMGLRTTPIGEITLDNCFIPKENLLGEEGSGAAIFNASQTWERAMILAPQIGIMENQLEKAIAHANKRHQYKMPIARFQAVSHRIVDMKMRLEIAKQLAYKAIWAIDNGHQADVDVSLANIYLSESFIDSSLDAIKVHGGRGYLTENEIERDMRDAVGGPIYAGTADIQRNFVAKAIGLDI